MKTATMSRGTKKPPKEQAYEMLTTPNCSFVQAVHRGSVEDAAQAAVNVLMVRTLVAVTAVRMDAIRTLNLKDSVYQPC